MTKLRTFVSWIGAHNDSFENGKVYMYGASRHVVSFHRLLSYGQLQNNTRSIRFIYDTAPPQFLEQRNRLTYRSTFRHGLTAELQKPSFHSR